MYLLDEILAVTLTKEHFFLILFIKETNHVVM